MEEEEKKLFLNQIFLAIITQPSGQFNMEEWEVVGEIAGQGGYGGGQEGVGGGEGRTECALVYRQETLSLHFEACCTHSIVDLDLSNREGQQKWG